MFGLVLLYCFIRENDWKYGIKQQGGIHEKFTCKWDLQQRAQAGTELYVPYDVIWCPHSNLTGAEIATREADLCLS